MASVSSVLKSTDGGRTWVKGEDVYLDFEGGADSRMILTKLLRFGIIVLQTGGRSMQRCPMTTARRGPTPGPYRVRAAKCHIAV